MPKKDVPYKKLAEELNEIMAWFESPDFDIDQALAQYQKGLEVIKAMESYLQTAENKIKKIKPNLDKA